MHESKSQDLDPGAETKKDTPLYVLNEAISQAVQENPDDATELRRIQAEVQTGARNAYNWRTPRYPDKTFEAENPGVTARKSIETATIWSLSGMNSLSGGLLTGLSLLSEFFVRGMPRGVEIPTDMATLGAVGITQLFLTVLINQFGKYESPKVQLNWFKSLLDAASGRGDISLQDAINQTLDSGKLTKPERLFLLIYGKLFDVVNSDILKKKT